MKQANTEDLNMRYFTIGFIICTLLIIAGSSALAQQKLPVGVVEIKPAAPAQNAENTNKTAADAAADTDADADTAKMTYRQSCAACHNGNLQHAPDFTDTAVRAQLKNNPVDALATEFIGGNLVHEAVMANSRLDDETLRAALSFLVNASDEDLK
jgi:cytochrome c5